MGDRGAHGYWFPLVLLGFGLLGLDIAQAHDDVGWFAYAPQPYQVEQHLTAYTIDVSRSFALSPYPMRDSSWAVLVAVTLVATVAWYGWRSRGSARRYIALAVGGAIVVLTCYVTAAMADSATSVGLSFLGLGAVAGVWARLRRQLVLAMLSALCLAIGVGTVVGSWAPALLDPIIIAGGLLVLARIERSRLLAVVAVVVGIAMVVFPVGTLSMLVPAALLLAAAIVTLVRRSGDWNRNLVIGHD